MRDAEWVQRQADISLERLWPRLEGWLRDIATPEERQVFETRL